MTEGGFYEPKKLSPTGIAVVVLLHGAALAALAMAKMDTPVMKIFKPLIIEDVVIPPDPEPIPEPRQQPKVEPRSQIDLVPPIVPPMPSSNKDVVLRPTPDIPVFTIDPPGRDEPVVVETPPVQPKAVPLPVRKDAEMLRSSELQPPYPASEERSGTEGKVSIRVRIGANGRVAAAEKVSATNDAFYRATERHALRAWRFKPASVDGKPVESSKVVNVTFRLNE